ncbi:hypothetical protein B0O79_0908 [Flavobacteriaceae bacterium MAR_2009_75]|nr:hypothetical protein B0O79_0908 [Flavobacteriaceae bacterium MAR_2009_75]
MHVKFNSIAFERNWLDKGDFSARKEGHEGRMKEGVRNFYN